MIFDFQLPLFGKFSKCGFYLRKNKQKLISKRGGDKK